MRYLPAALIVSALALAAACDHGGRARATGAAPVITTTELPDAITGRAFSFNIEVQGGDAAAFAWSSGYTPPAWLQLSSRGGLSGTPTQAGSTVLQVTALGTGALPSSASVQLDLTVLAADPAITTTIIPRGTRGQAYLAQLEADAPGASRPAVWMLTASSVPLPAGLTLQPDGELSGTPAVGGLFELEVSFELFTSPYTALIRRLDLVIYEAAGYAHAPDAFDSSANNDFAHATPLGALATSTPLVQATPLSVTSDPADPNTDPVDIFTFTTPHTGEITAEVFFAAGVGKLAAVLYRDAGGRIDHAMHGVAGAGGNDAVVQLPGAEPGTWYLAVEAVAKNSVYHSNAFAFRVRFNDLTIPVDLVEHDTSTGAVAQPLPVLLAGSMPGTAAFQLAAGALPPGISLSADGVLQGTPTQTGLFDFTVQVEVSGLMASRALRMRIYDSAAGNYWRRAGDRRYFDPTRSDGAGLHHEHYCEGLVVAPHPDYGAEGAIYVIGGRVDATVPTVYVFHTAHQQDTRRNHRLEDIGRPLTTERQFVGAAYLQHSYGGYIYAVGGELHSSTMPSSGRFTRVVERMQVADGSGAPLPTPGQWTPVAELPAALGGSLVEGWAEFGLVAAEAAQDADDRLYLIGGRLSVETAAGSGMFAKQFNNTVLMFEPPSTASGSGLWTIKPDTGTYVPRRFPAVGWVGGAIYMAGGWSMSGALSSIEMYRPDPSGLNPALATIGPSGLPTLTAPIWYGAGSVHGGKFYILNGWSGSYTATSRLQRFDPVAGTLETLATPDFASGFHSAVFHGGRLWFMTGRNPFAPTPKFSLWYSP